MCSAEGVVNTFFAARKAGDAAFLAQLRHSRFTAGEYLVSVGLVANVPHQTIIGRIENVVQSDSQFDGAEIRRKMSAGGGHRFNDEFAQFLGKRRQIASIELAQIGWVVDLVEERVFGHERVCSLMLSPYDELSQLTQALCPVAKTTQCIQRVLQ